MSTMVEATHRQATAAGVKMTGSPSTVPTMGMMPVRVPRVEQKAEMKAPM